MEDDEKAPGTKSFQTVIGSPSNIIALNDCMVGVHIGGIRRFSILPQKGWQKPTPMCDGGPGGTHVCLTGVMDATCGNDPIAVTNQDSIILFSHQVEAPEET